jgi:hypothetical protein
LIPELGVIRFSGFVEERRRPYHFTSKEALESWFSGFRFVSLLDKMVATPDHHEDRRHKKQGADSSQDESTDNGSAEGCILFATFAQA